MRKLVRRWYWWLPALLVAAGVGYVAYRAMHPPWVDTEAWETYQQIRIGMTYSEAEAIVGKLHLRYGWGYGSCYQVGDDEVFIECAPWEPGNPVVQKYAEIQGNRFADPPDDQRRWWQRWRARLGW